MGTTKADKLQEENPVTTEEIDFSGKDFEQTQKLLNLNAQKSSMLKELEDVRKQKRQITGEAFAEPKMVNITGNGLNNPEDVIDYHLDKYTFEELQKYLGGDIKDNKALHARIDEFFTNPETEEVLELRDNSEVKNTTQEYDFKRGLLLYFKQNDEYMKGIDEEIQKLNQATEDMNEELSAALNPLKDNIYGYAQYLEDHNQPNEGDDSNTKKIKEMNRKKARAIRSGFTLENMIELVEKCPSIKKNALSDFKKDSRIRDIGARYASKLKTSKIDFNLFKLITDDPKESLEYRALPLDDYPAGLEGFTIFFIIRSLSMSLPDPVDATFHASVQVVYTQLLEGTLDPEIADIVRNSIKKFLSYFAD